MSHISAIFVNDVLFIIAFAKSVQYTLKAILIFLMILCKRFT